MHLSISSSEHAPRQTATAALRGFACFFFLSIVALFSASEWLVRTHVLPQDTLAAHRDLLATNTRPNAAFGDSHVARGFDAPQHFANLAYPSENIEEMIAKITHNYLHRAPGRVILQADPHLFSPYRVYGAASASNAPQLPAIFSDRHRPRLLAYWEVFVRGKGTMDSKVTMTPNGSLLSGGDLSLDAPRRKQFDARTRAFWHRIIPSEAVTTAKARYAGLLDLLNEQGANVCLVSFPVSPAYRLAIAAAHAEQIAFFRAQAARVGARYVDARADVRPLHHFRDVDHLNIEGARAFSPTLLGRCFDEGP
jgi:hypothetical protein